MKTNRFNVKHHSNTGPGGWTCICCGPAPKNRKVVARRFKRKTYRDLDKLDRIDQSETHGVQEG